MLNPKKAKVLMSDSDGGWALSSLQRVTVKELKELVENIARVNTKP
jgi:hypothetical protein